MMMRVDNDSLGIGAVMTCEIHRKAEISCEKI